MLFTASLARYKCWHAIVRREGGKGQSEGHFSRSKCEGVFLSEEKCSFIYYSLLARSITQRSNQRPKEAIAGRCVCSAVRSHSPVHQR